jgi:hypothetical protein
VILTSTHDARAHISPTHSDMNRKHNTTTRGSTYDTICNGDDASNDTMHPPVTLLSLEAPTHHRRRCPRHVRSGAGARVGAWSCNNICYFRIYLHTRFTDLTRHIYGMRSPISPTPPKSAPTRSLLNMGSRFSWPGTMNKQSD